MSKMLSAAMVQMRVWESRGVAPVGERGCELEKTHYILSKCNADP
jgi:hypothetical protein